MRLFPVNLLVEGKETVVVGGGSVALRKVSSLLQAGARVTVISPELHPGLRDLNEVRHIARSYAAGDLDGAFLAFAATGDAQVNRAVSAEGEARRVPVCVADDPSGGSFTSPSVIRRGELLLTVSTGGRSPFLAAAIRRKLEKEYGAEYAGLVEAVGEIREKLLTEKTKAAYNGKLFHDLTARDWLDLLHREGKSAAADLLLTLLNEEAAAGGEDKGTR